MKRGKFKFILSTFLLLSVHSLVGLFVLCSFFFACIQQLLIRICGLRKWNLPNCPCHECDEPAVFAKMEAQHTITTSCVCISYWLLTKDKTLTLNAKVISKFCLDQQIYKWDRTLFLKTTQTRWLVKFQ